MTQYQNLLKSETATRHVIEHLLYFPAQRKYHWLKFAGKLGARGKNMTSLIRLSEQHFK